MLSLSHVTYHPPASATPILTDINLQLAVGELGLIVGPSGSGKSTLLEIMSGLANPTGGAIRWRDQLLTDLHLHQLCGLVFQFPERHFCGNTVLEELRLGHPEIRSETIHEVLAAVGLGDISLAAVPHQLSGGQQRRLALAVQLIRQPRILLLDEPTAGLDWSVRQQLLALLRELKGRWTLLIVSHDPDELMPFADRVWRIHQGHLDALVDPAIA